ncbi:MAG: 3'-5' exonuclease, partial [Bacteriovoracaceae bacterium]|nr:3'-5' exonuclease [Bacteriovoracaceae bacterium]
MTQTSQELLKDLSFCVFDLETTGGNHEHDQIIEIGLVRIEKLKIRSEKSYLINPDVKIPSYIQKLTSLTPMDLEGSPKIQNVIDDILDFMKDSILVAHNTSFDVPFFNSVLKRLQKAPLKNKVLCTNIMTQHLIPEILNSNLTYMCNLFGIKLSNAHRAKEDTRATAELLLIFLESFAKRGLRKVNQLYYPRNKFELDRFHLFKHEMPKNFSDPFKKILSPFVITVKNAQGSLVSMLPIEDFLPEKDFLTSYLQEEDWEQLTVRFCGSYLEALIQTQIYLDKIPTAQRERLKNYLQQRNNPAEGILDDFVIVPHLVDDQFALHPIHNMGLKNRLLFKFPMHQRKLEQYLIKNNTHHKKKAPSEKNISKIIDS